MIGLKYISGDQPSGTMSFSFSQTPLPGVSDCGTITITYTFPSGVQEVGVKMKS